MRYHFIFFISSHLRCRDLCIVIFLRPWLSLSSCHQSYETFFFFFLVFFHLFCHELGTVILLWLFLPFFIWWHCVFISAHSRICDLQGFRNLLSQVLIAFMVTVPVVNVRNCIRCGIAFLIMGRYGPLQNFTGHRIAEFPQSQGTSPWNQSLGVDHWSLI